MRLLWLADRRAVVWRQRLSVFRDLLPVLRRAVDVYQHPLLGIDLLADLGGDGAVDLSDRPPLSDRARHLAPQPLHQHLLGTGYRGDAPGDLSLYRLAALHLRARAAIVDLRSLSSSRLLQSADRVYELWSDS